MVLDHDANQLKLLLDRSWSGFVFDFSILQIWLLHFRAAENTSNSRRNTGTWQHCQWRQRTNFNAPCCASATGRISIGTWFTSGMDFFRPTALTPRHSAICSWKIESLSHLWLSRRAVFVNLAWLRWLKVPNRKPPTIVIALFSNKAALKEIRLMINFPHLLQLLELVHHCILCRAERHLRCCQHSGSGWKMDCNYIKTEQHRTYNGKCWTLCQLDWPHAENHGFLTAKPE